MKIGDSAIAASFLLFGLYVLFESRQLNASAGYGLGPGFFPFWLAIGLVLLGAMVLVQTFKKDKQSQEALARAVVKKRLLIAAAFLAFVPATAFCGFLVAFSLLVAFVLYWIEGEAGWRAALISVATGLGFQIFFVRLLEVELPKGPWGF